MKCLIFTLFTLMAFGASAQNKITTQVNLGLKKSQSILRYDLSDVLLVGPLLGGISEIAYDAQDSVNDIPLVNVNFADKVVGVVEKERVAEVQNIYLSGDVSIKTSGIRLAASLSLGSSSISLASFESIQSLHISPGVVKLIGIDFTPLEINRDLEFVWYDVIEIGYMNRINWESIMLGQNMNQTFSIRLNAPFNKYSTKARKYKEYRLFVEQFLVPSKGVKSIGTYQAGITIQIK